MADRFRATKRGKRSGLAATVTSLAMATLVNVPAKAQQDAGAPATKNTNPEAAASQEQSTAGLNDIIVTASKREERAQRVALSITAVEASALEARGITQPDQLAGLAPGIQLQSSFLLLTYIRGVGNYSAQPAVDQSVAYNVDGNYVSRPYAMPSILFDLDRVELLRGPQGTLQGRNSTGGSINIVTARPNSDFEASASLSYGNYSAVTIEGMINIPIAADVALRISGASSDHSGYFDNGFGDANRMGVRARLMAAPTSRLNMLLTAEFNKRNEKGSTYSACPPGSIDAACAGVPWRPFSGTPGQGTDPVNNIDEPNLEVNKNYSVYAEITYDLNFATLTWAPSYRYVNHHGVLTISNPFGSNVAAHDHMHSEEIRLSSKSGSPVAWVAGLYYGRQRSAEQFYFLTGAGPSISVQRPGFSPVGHVFYFNDVQRYVYTSKSAFGQVSVPIFEGFRVVAGGRYTQDRKSIIGRTGLVIGPTLATDTAASQSLNKFTYKVGVEYDAAPSVLLYANISTGFKSGGVNGIPPGSGLPETFSPETNKAYQAGIKSRFLDNRVQINAEGFYYDYRGYLVSAFGVAPPGVLVALNLNSQKARMYGGEIEGSVLFSRNDQLDVGLSFLNAKYRKFDIPAAGLNLDGKPMQNAPHFTFTGNYRHTFEFSNGARVVAHGEVRYESEQWTDYRLSPGSLVGGYWHESADLTYHSADDRWSLGAFVRNISNDGTPLTVQAGLAATEVAVSPTPRTYGVRATARF